MTSSLQGIIIALLISLLIGVIIGYSLRQGRISELTNALKQSQKRNEELEREHEQRLQEATLRLQEDYEVQLAEKIERYQDQLEERTAELEQEYQGRLAVLEQGRLPYPGVPAGPGSGSGVGISTESGISTGPQPALAADLSYVEQQVKRQYEERLKEAARKIQLAYEQHLRQKLKDTRDDLQKDYERRLAQKIEHYEDEATNRINQLQEEYELRLQALGPAPAAPGATWDNTLAMTAASVQMAMPSLPTVPEVSLVASDRAAEELENRLRAEYEQKLAEKIEHYQDDLAQRVQSLEAEYEARLQVSQQAQPAEVPLVIEEVNIEEVNIEAVSIESVDLEHGLSSEEPSDLQDMFAVDLIEVTAPETALGLDTALEDAFSLEEVLVDTDPTTPADEDALNLGGDFDAQDFNLDELLFEQSQEGSEDLPPDLDDISRLR